MIIDFFGSCLCILSLLKCLFLQKVDQHCFETDTKTLWQFYSEVYEMVRRYLKFLSLVREHHKIFCSL